MASAWKYGNTMKADIKKTINKIIFTQATTFSKALIKKLNTTPWGRSVKQVQWESESDWWAWIQTPRLQMCIDTAETWRKPLFVVMTEGTFIFYCTNQTGQCWFKGSVFGVKTEKSAVVQFWSHSWVVVTIFWTTRDSLVNRQEVAAARGVRAGRRRRLANISVTRHLKV